MTSFVTTYIQFVSKMTAMFKRRAILVHNDSTTIDYDPHVGAVVGRGRSEDGIDLTCF